MKSGIFDPSIYYFNYNAIIPAFVVLTLIFINIHVLFKVKNSASSLFTFYLLIKVTWLSGMAVIYSTKNYLAVEAAFNARPWNGIKEETVLGQKEEEEYYLIFDDNPDKAAAKQHNIK